MIGALVWFATFTLTADESGAWLPVESATLYRSGHAWLLEAGKAPVKNGAVAIRIRPNAVPGTWRAEPADPAQGKLLSFSVEPYGWVYDPASRRFDPRVFVRIKLGAEELVGRIIEQNEGTTPHIGLLTDSGAVRLVPLSSISAIEPRATDPTATLRLETNAGEVAVRANSLVAGIGWTPSYRLDVGPEGRSLLELLAELFNHGQRPIETEKVECSLALPQVGAERDSPVNDGTVFSIGARTIAPGQAELVRLSRVECLASELFEWRVSETRTSGGQVSPAEEVTAILQVPNRTAQSLPEGPILVTAGSRLLANAILPYTPRDANAEIRLGPAGGIQVAREETELERKQSAVRRENEEYDWVRMAGALRIANSRPAPIRVRVIKRFEGEGIAASDNGVLQRSANQVGRDRPLTEIRWDITVPAGQEKRLTFGFELHLAPQ